MSETPLAQLRKLAAAWRARAQAFDPDDAAFDQARDAVDDCADELSALLTDLEAAPRRARRNFFQVAADVENEVEGEAAASRPSAHAFDLFPEAGRDAADADVLSDLQAYIRHNAVVPSDHEGSGRVVPLSSLRSWIQQEKQKRNEAAASQAEDDWTPLDGSLTIRFLQYINAKRADRWHGLKSWSALEWAGAMAGEAGEACNAAKKLKRVEDQIANINLEDGRSLTDVQTASSKIVDEIADTVIYGVLLAERVGLDLEEAIRMKFNRKSEEYGFPERIPPNDRAALHGPAADGSLGSDQERHA